MNTPVGIPSGWEEKAAYRYMSLYILDRDIGWMDINWSALVIDVYWRCTHDWRVAE